MLDFVKTFERGIIAALIVMMTIVLLLATLELGYILAKDILTPPVLILEIGELHEIFGLFLIVLIGIELLETIRTYFSKNVIHVHVVFTVAIIAIARKVIILDISKMTELALAGIASIILALAVGYYLIKKADERAG